LTKKKAASLIVLLTLSLLTTNVYANGIPIIFAVSVLHVIFINSFVIVIETLLLKKFSKDKIIVGYMILANLASLFLAFALTTSAISSYFNNQWFGLQGKGVIEKKIFLSGVAVFILLTILIEWIFYHLAQKNRRSWLRSLKYSTIINLITNIPIALFYLVNNLYYDVGD
jgi:hypothetical protein